MKMDQISGAKGLSFLHGSSVSRRRRRAQWVLLLLVFLLAAMLAWGAFIEPSQLRWRQFTLTHETLPSRLQPLRLGVMSDLHVGGPHMAPERLQRLVTEMNDRKPHLVLLLGDFMTEDWAAETVLPKQIAEILGRLQAPLGVFSVLGNHDHWYGGQAVIEALSGEGISVLENDAAPVALPNGAGQLWIAGLADDSTRSPDIAAALAPVPGDAPVLVLAHDPASFALVPERVILTLAGHTHAGQMKIPGIGPLINVSSAPRAWAYGLVRERERVLYTTAGLGTSILPLRINAPPEMVLITLQPKAPQP